MHRSLDNLIVSKHRIGCSGVVAERAGAAAQSTKVDQDLTGEVSEYVRGNQGPLHSRVRPSDATRDGLSALIASGATGAAAAVLPAFDRPQADHELPADFETNADVLGKVYRRCTSPSSSQSEPFVDELCHLSWRYLLSDGDISAVTHVDSFSRGAATHAADAASLEDLGDAQLYLHNVSHMQVSLRASGERHLDSLAMPCAAWQGVAMTYVIDRLFQVHRFPPTVIRSWSVGKLNKAAPVGVMRRRIDVVAQECGSPDHNSVLVANVGRPHIFGSMEKFAWTKWLAVQHFRIPKVSQSQLEFSRLLISMLLRNDVSPLLNGGSNLVVVSESGSVHTHMLMTSFSSLWTKGQNDLVGQPLPPLEANDAHVCTRHTGDNPFICSSRATLSTPAQATHFILQYLREACIWPAGIALTVTKFSARPEFLETSLEHMLDFMAERESLDGGDVQLDDKTRQLLADLSERAFQDVAAVVFQLRSVLDECLELYDKEHVVFDEEVHGALVNTVDMHVSPAGTRFIKDDESGVWRRLRDDEEYEFERARHPAVVAVPRDHGISHKDEKMVRELAEHQHNRDWLDAVFHVSEGSASPPPVDNRVRRKEEADQRKSNFDNPKATIDAAAVEAELAAVERHLRDQQHQERRLHDRLADTATSPSDLKDLAHRLDLAEHQISLLKEEQALLLGQRAQFQEAAEAVGAPPPVASFESSGWSILEAVDGSGGLQ